MVSKKEERGYQRGGWLLRLPTPPLSTLLFAPHPSAHHHLCSVILDRPAAQQKPSPDVWVDISISHSLVESLHASARQRPRGCWSCPTVCVSVQACVCVHACVCLTVSSSPLLSAVILPASGFDKDKHCGGKWLQPLPWGGGVGAHASSCRRLPMMHLTPPVCGLMFASASFRRRRGTSQRSFVFWEITFSKFTSS